MIFGFKKTRPSLVLFLSRLWDVVGTWLIQNLAQLSLQSASNLITPREQKA